MSHRPSSFGIARSLTMTCGCTTAMMASASRALRAVRTVAPNCLSAVPKTSRVSALSSTISTRMPTRLGMREVRAADLEVSVLTPPIPSGEARTTRAAGPCRGLRRAGSCGPGVGDGPWRSPRSDEVAGLGLDHTGLPQLDGRYVVFSRDAQCEDEHRCR